MAVIAPDWQAAAERGTHAPDRNAIAACCELGDDPAAMQAVSAGPGV